MCKALLTFKCGFFPPCYPKNLTHPYQCVSFLPPLTIVTGGERFLENCYLFHLFSNAILLLTENSGSLLNLFFKIYIHIYLLFYLLFLFTFRERGREGEREREKHQCVVAFHVPPTGDLACSPGVCPDWEWNWRLFVLQASVQSTELHEPRHQLCFLIPAPFPPFSPFSLPTDNLPNDLHVYDSVRVLVVCLFCFFFRFSC